MDGGNGFVERTFQKRLMIVFAVMVRDGAGPPLRGAVANILQTPVQQGQHIVGRARVEQVVGVGASQIYWRRMRHDTPPPTVVMFYRRIVRPAAPRAEPRRSVYFQRRL